MAIDTDDDILQDFLVEAGEILEKLGEQLVDLERCPRDSDLLNAVFRGFHTVKGGAGFLNLTSLVAVCHRAEDVFNTLRQGKRLVDAPLMDVILTVLDLVKAMMDQVRSGEDPSPADPSLLKELDVLAQPQNDSGAMADTPGTFTAMPEPIAEPVSEVMGDNVVEASLTADSPDQTIVAAGGDDITDDEFEALLDQLHGQGTHAGSPSKNTIGIPPLSSTSPSSDMITDEEFEALLDKLNGAPEKPQDKPLSKPVIPPIEESRTTEIQSTTTEDKPAASQPPAAGKDAAQPPADTTVRVDTKRLDDIMNLVGELVLVRNRLATLKSSMVNEEMAQVIGNLDLVTSDLQNAVMKTRMQPIKKVFGRFPRVVRDLARSLNKEVILELHGEETDLDKNLVEALADPLVHLVRNAVDHGIESPDVRLAAGKPRAGTVILSAQQEGDHILLSIEEDGAGMDAEVLRRKAVEKGLLDPEAAARLDDNGCYNLIFLPGFSTKAQISDVSGRGVGMDVVKTRIAQLNGVVEIESKLGKGSRFIIKVPLTLAIMPTLMVMLGQQIFAMPLVNVSEIFNLNEARTNTVDGRLVVIVRNRAIPLFYLHDWLVKDTDYSHRSEGYVVVVSVGSQRIGCVVENLIGQEEVVIKPLGSLLHGTLGLSGATITGNGRIALILDFPGLMDAYGHR
ncbi:MAG: chemotaxis protein CheA [Gammaproteobacteria bacterium]|jgi:two-component system chemotaxis sensor kinase CheA|nr:chemotaxis protein CheA [Gammaproteobacteria bacterium]